MTSAPSQRSQSATATDWDHRLDTVRREKLFRDPPADHSAYPALHQAVCLHLESFNRLFPSNGGAARVEYRAGHQLDPDLDPNPYSTPRNHHHPQRRSQCLLSHALADLGEQVFFDGPDKLSAGDQSADRNRLAVRITSVSLQKPQLPATNKSARRREILPADCRERHLSYRGRLSATFSYTINGGRPSEFSRDLGLVPVMVMSNRCHLQHYSPAQLVATKEESEELGGYFIINGNEKIVRLLQVNKRNYPLAIIRPTFARRGPEYSKYGITIRCVRPDETSQSNVLHYLDNGSIIFRFSWRKREYLVPVAMILKALIDTNDREIVEKLAGSSPSPNKTYVMDRVEMMLRTFKTYQLYGRRQSRAYLGSKFRVVLGVPPTLSDLDAGTEFLRKIVLVHLGNVDVTDRQDGDKFRLLLLMIRKLYALVAGECSTDNPDTVQNQEILLGGFLYGMILKERLDEYLSTSMRKVVREYVRKNPGVSFASPHFARQFPQKVLARASENLGVSLEYFLSTGNLASPSGLDLQQVAGFVVVAERLNFLRFISHFGMVHRGAFFAQLKTTTVRKLLPESWGFLCPVHTPDGAPCGLLNHLAHLCRVVTQGPDVSAIPALVSDLGAMEDEQGGADTSEAGESVPVLLDGRVLGWCHPVEARRISDCLRFWKVEGTHQIPRDLEIGHVPPSNGGSYPGVFMTSTPARMLRPVWHLALDREDLIGPHEQPYLSIAVTVDQMVSGRTTHVETAPTNMLSIVANMTPFSDHNQSPRNMYQCQMGKQTMGTPGTALAHRADHKLYRLQTGQTPVVRPPLHNAYGFDNFPNGTNAIVAVISYTGYDMDDAMIINKSAHERGFGHGTIYKTKLISLRPDRRIRTAARIGKMFGFAPKGFVPRDHRAVLDEDGLPRVGARVEEGEALCAWHTVSPNRKGQPVNLDGETHVEWYRDSEPAYIEQVRLMAADSGTEPIQEVAITLRVPRGPVTGDKFSSRHGQKGVLSHRWPAVDMPFTESGMQPDIIINPHAFPSRMTIGMFVESLAGKVGALHGQAQDSTPFKFGDGSGDGSGGGDKEGDSNGDRPAAADYFGAQLVRAGFNFHGSEPMYSGVTGEELAADIFIGLVYYQRLRHMVNDKFQVRTTGPVVPTTMQPVHGRQRGGGVRVGEMERDALLAHGAAFLVQDRLLNCSDYSHAWVCRRCGSLLSVQPSVPPFGGASAASHRRAPTDVRCRRCAVPITSAASTAPATAAASAAAAASVSWFDGHGVRYLGGDETALVAVPGALRYLDAELAAMGIKLRFHVDSGDLPVRGKARPLKLSEGE